MTKVDDFLGYFEPKSWMWTLDFESLIICFWPWGRDGVEWASQSATLQIQIDEARKFRQYGYQITGVLVILSLIKYAFSISVLPRG